MWAGKIVLIVAGIESDRARKIKKKESQGFFVLFDVSFHANHF
jgi:hypothetical protein